MNRNRNKLKCDALFLRSTKINGAFYFHKKVCHVRPRKHAAELIALLRTQTFVISMGQRSAERAINSQQLQFNLE